MLLSVPNHPRPFPLAATDPLETFDRREDDCGQGMDWAQVGRSEILTETVAE